TKAEPSPQVALCTTQKDEDRHRTNQHDQEQDAENEEPSTPNATTIILDLVRVKSRLRGHASSPGKSATHLLRCPRGEVCGKGGGIENTREIHLAGADGSSLSTSQSHFLLHGSTMMAMMSRSLSLVW